MGSFDCVALRFAQANFAQDDRVMDDARKYYVYIVCSGSGTLYIGVTNNIERRMREHKSGDFEGFASRYGCDRLVYRESFEDVHKAIGREKQLKVWVRRKKIALIESVNPTWQDLAEKWGAQLAFSGQSIS
jgi:putative endonuclease